ncbi:MAG: hypothetical protein ABMA26_01015 [Limisphaerales bacterium]
MNPNDPPTSDARLRGLLRMARPGTELPPGFQTAVWQRIERREADAPASWLERLAACLLRPQWAAAGLAAVMAAGVVLGTQRTPTAEAVSAQDRYVAAVNPFLPRP